MTLQTNEFIRRFLMHVLPSGFHRIRHYGLLSNKTRKETLPLSQKHLQVMPVTQETNQTDKDEAVFTCRVCGEAMIVISVVERQYTARGPPLQELRS